MKKEKGIENKLKLDWRPAQEKDIEFARKTHHCAYRDVVIKQFGEWNEESQDKNFESVWREFPHEIMSINGQLCGYFSMSESDEFITLHELVLLPEFQGQGVGSEVLNKIIKTAKARNISVILYVLKENRAIELYHKFGFKQAGETETHFKMEYVPTELK